MLNPGKYDDEAQRIFDKTLAKAVILIVLDGDKGSGMSVKADYTTSAMVPNILRHTADVIEEELQADLAEIRKRN